MKCENMSDVSAKYIIRIMSDIGNEMLSIKNYMASSTTMPPLVFSFETLEKCPLHYFSLIKLKASILRVLHSEMKAFGKIFVIC